MTRFLRILGMATVGAIALLVAVWMHLPSGQELRARAFTASYATEVYDRDGQYVGLLPAPGSSYGPHTQLEEVPDALIGDLVTVEGMAALGFSPWAFLRALITWEGGGSTISQQVYRTITGDDVPTIRRKLVEMVGAVKLSLNFSREEILELYLNQIHWIESEYSGIAVAARQVFNKRPGELERPEWLVLISALPAPSVRGDYSKQSKSQIRPPYERRVDLLYEEGRITEQERRKLKATLPAPSPPAYSRVPTDPFLRRVAARLDSLGAKGVAQALKVKTTIDLDVQRAVHRRLQDVETGRPTFFMLNARQEAISYYGGNPPPGGLDLLRSGGTRPSSRMKPLVYAAYAEQLIEENGYSASEILQVPMPDSIRIGDKVVQDEGTGTPTLREALIHSFNAPAYHAIRKVGPENFARFARKLGVNVPPRPSVALGAASVSEVDLTAAYSSLLLREGRWARPTFIKEIRSRRTGDVLYKHDSSGTSAEPVVSDATVAALRHALRAAAHTGTSKGLTRQTGDNQLWQMHDLYPKTGTSPSESDYRYLGLTGVYGSYAASLTVQGRLGDRLYSSGVAVPAARRVMNGVCGLGDIGC
jgi:penicillin-binding protein 1A